ncbi:hypothetical protein L227DRAFT_234552 [Lentinus tigrinus ALCF2SS1-6]|uniref:Uncharacterized protein n=1 Tax=Lentinus tigrinus ALCF2SS1-6 TaxID=1328759 RepID=A0A5C2S1J7_9APHY|nr:hypothetical protein L227DRAFT_234552 [Lentinus tigrinus ALCF2SS1-6]
MTATSHDEVKAQMSSLALVLLTIATVQPPFSSLRCDRYQLLAISDRSMTQSALQANQRPRPTYECIDDACMTTCGLSVRHTPWFIGRSGGEAHSRKLRKPERSSAILKHRSVSAREARHNKVRVYRVILYCANASLVCQKVVLRR